MGAWGAEPFDNDDAADWSAEFDGVDGSTGLRLLRDALQAADISEYLESPAGATAVAAAQVVGWLLVPNAMQETPYSESVVAWVRSSAPEADQHLIDSARQALRRVRSNDSELAELWADAADDDWMSVLDRIDSSLNQAN